jgi:opacity protein-like surface antigen
MVILTSNLIIFFKTKFVKTVKFLSLILLTSNCFLTPNLSFAALNGGNSSASSLSNKEFSQSAIGAGLALGVRFNLVGDLFVDSEEIDFDKKTTNIAKKPDHIFTEIGIFGNQFFVGEIKQNFGGKINLGYENHGFRIYGSGGYVASTIDYQETGQSKKSLIKSAPFIGGGIGYDITKNISLRLDGMFYNVDFKPKNSSFEKVDVNVAAGTIGVGFYF